MMTAIIIFTKNEEKIISLVIDKLRFYLKQIPELKAKIFICDDSSDRTQQIAREKGCEILQGSGKGLGWSYYLALYVLSSKQSFDSIITLDGDGQTDLSEWPFFYEEFKQGWDMVVGSRFLKRGSISYSYSKINFIGVKILSFIISLSALKKFTDSHGGLRIMKAEVVKNLKFLGGHSYVQETLIEAVSKGFKVKELASKWQIRPYGQSRVVRSKLKYIKAMAIPLALRMRIHGFLAFIALALLAFFKIFFWPALLLGISAIIEYYKVGLFRRNRLKIKKGVVQK